MVKLMELLSEAEVLVNRVVYDIDQGSIGLQKAEERILEYVNKVGSLLVEQVVDQVEEPIVENRVWVDGNQALYKESSAMRFRNRFGGWIRRVRRGFRVEGEHGRWHPLDQKLGIDRCCGTDPGAPRGLRTPQARLRV